MRSLALFFFSLIKELITSVKKIREGSSMSAEDSPFIVSPFNALHVYM